MKERGLSGRLRNGKSKLRQKRGPILGLAAFEKISAVEGICLSQDMKRDLTSMDAKHVSDADRTRFIRSKYGAT